MLSLTIFCILPSKLLLKSIATSADWCLGQELQKDIPVHTFCHCVSVILFECVSYNKAKWNFLVFKRLKVLFLLLELFRPLTFAVKILNL